MVKKEIRRVYTYDDIINAMEFETVVPSLVQIAKTLKEDSQYL